MPVISQHVLSTERLLRRRAKAERLRVSRGERHLLHYFHQVDDPYGALVTSILPRLLERYDVDLCAHVVGPPPDSAAPEREKLVAYSRRDAQLLARHWGLEFHDKGRQPSTSALLRASAKLVAAAEDGSFVAVAGAISAALWSDTSEQDDANAALPTASATLAHQAQADALRKRLGHYLGATFCYAGEWYWGLDRLHHLERRLQALGVQQAGVADLMFPPSADLQTAQALADPAPIDFYFSLRSPYSAIVTERIFKLSQVTGAPLRLRYVLPMVMRGLPVPAEKRSYIAHDAGREAALRGIPFGRLNDPVGRPAERGLALIPLAQRAGKAQEYLLSFMRGVWAEGIDAGSDSGLRRIAERAGLDWELARAALLDDDWRVVAEQNRAEMFALGLWGVPSFRVRDMAVWGQDRLWVIEDELLKGRA